MWAELKAWWHGVIDPDWVDPAEARKELVIEYEVPDSDFQELRLDGRRLRLVGGTARARVAAGTYRLHARGITQPDREYSIKITAPEEAKWIPDPKRRADSRGRINDLHRVVIEP